MSELMMVQGLIALFAIILIGIYFLLKKQISLLAEISKKNAEEQRQTITLVEGRLSSIEQSLIELTKSVRDTNQSVISKPFYQASIDLDNEIRKLGEDKGLIVKGDGLIKHVSGFKVDMIEDVENEQVTEFIYEDTKKIRIDTFSKGALKYQMFLNQSEKPELGFEYDESERKKFEYHYDSSGELEKRIDYAEDGSITNETKY